MGSEMCIRDSIQNAHILALSQSEASIPVTIATASDSDRTTCINIPPGYRPVAGASFLLLDTDGNSSAVDDSVVTDQCGLANIPVTAATDLVVAQSDGNRDVRIALNDGNTVTADTSRIATAVPQNADYDIGLFRLADSGEINFTVNDTRLNKAVLGLPADSVKLETQDGLFGLSSVQLVSVDDAASIALVLDASGSMSQETSIFADDGRAMTRQEVAAQAAHQFLDSKASNDEVSLIVFDNRFSVDLMTDDFINTSMPLINTDGSRFTYVGLADGFSRNSRYLRLPIDGYNSSSELWLDNSGFTPRHPETSDAVFISGSRYPWGGKTAFFDANLVAIDALANRAGDRKFVIALSDGNDNQSRNSLNNVINQAAEQQVAVYTIGFEFDSESNLRSLAESTGASYFEATSPDLSAVFDGIRTGIVFTYTAIPGSPVNTAGPVTLIVDIDQDGIPEATRQLAMPRRR